MNGISQKEYKQSLCSYVLIDIKIQYFALQGTITIHIFVPYKQQKLISIRKKAKRNQENEMNVDNVKSQMRKGMLEYCIMLLLHKEAAYASDIIQKLKEAKLIVVEGTLYPLLTRLKNDDLLSYEWIESTQGPPRKYYRLTEKGENFLRELEASWKELNDTVNHLAGSVIGAS